MARTSRSCALFVVMAVCVVGGCKDPETSSATPPSPSAKPDPRPMVAAQPAGELDPTTLPAIAAVVPADFVPQQLPSGEMKFKTPATWKKATRDSGGLMTLKLDQQGSNMKLQGLDLPPDYSVARVAGEIVELYPRSVPAGMTAKHTGTAYLQVASSPAARLTFDMSVRGEPLKQQHTLIQKGKRVFHVTVTVPARQYAATCLQVDQMLESVEFPQ